MPDQIATLMAGTRVPERRRTDSEWSHEIHTRARAGRRAGRAQPDGNCRPTHSSVEAVETGRRRPDRAARQRTAATAAPRAAPRQSQQGAAVQQQRSYARAPRSEDQTGACSAQAQPQGRRSTATVLHAAAAVRRAAGTVLRPGTAVRRAAGTVLRAGAVPRPSAPQQQSYTQRAVPRPGPAPRGDGNRGDDNSRGYGTNRGYDSGRAYGNRTPVYNNNSRLPRRRRTPVVCRAARRWLWPRIRIQVWIRVRLSPVLLPALVLLRSGRD